MCRVQSDRGRVRPDRPGAGLRPHHSTQFGQCQRAVPQWLAGACARAERARIPAPEGVLRPRPVRLARSRHGPPGLAADDPVRTDGPGDDQWRAGSGAGALSGVERGHQRHARPTSHRHRCPRPTIAQGFRRRRSHLRPPGRPKRRNRPVPDGAGLRRVGHCVLLQPDLGHLHRQCRFRRFLAGAAAERVDHLWRPS